MTRAALFIGLAFGFLMGALIMGGRKEVPVIIRLDTGKVESASIMDIMMSFDVKDFASGWIKCIREHKIDFVEQEGVPAEHAANFVMVLDEAAKRWTKEDGKWIELRDEMIRLKIGSYR